MDGGQRGTVVVTGASTGIGLATARHLDDLGFDVLAGVRKPQDAERLGGLGSDRLQALTIDVADQASIDSAAVAVSDAVGGRGLAGLVNNAGIVAGAPMEILPLDELRRQLEVNVIGQVAVSQALLPLLRVARGRLVNMGSVGGRMTAPGIGAYAASKYALEAVNDALRQELHPWGIRVSIIEPGAIATPIWDKSAKEGTAMLDGVSEEKRHLYRDQIASLFAIAEKTGRRGLPPEKVAETVAHALTAKRPKARYVVGTDARIQILLTGLLPERVSDAIIRRVARA